MTNSRGDIEELRHLNGSLIARYKYDVWGNTLSIVDASGNEITSSTALPVQNPFRYRGYYFDNESGLYYLQSRYYDPVTCRFVSADSLVDTTDILGFNMYAYCANNPVNNFDPSGHIIIGAVVGGIVGGLAGALSAAVKGESIWAGALTGATTGAISGAIVDFAVATGGVGVALISAIAVSTVNVVGDVANQYINYKIKEGNSKNSKASNKDNITNSNQTNKNSSFSNYIDKKSLAITAITSLAFSPVSIGSGQMVNAAFNGFGKCACDLIAEVIVSSVYEINTSVCQSIVQMFFEGV